MGSGKKFTPHIVHTRGLSVPLVFISSYFLLPSLTLFLAFCFLSLALGYGSPLFQLSLLSSLSINIVVYVDVWITSLYFRFEIYFTDENLVGGFYMLVSDKRVTREKVVEREQSSFEEECKEELILIDLSYILI